MSRPSRLALTAVGLSALFAGMASEAGRLLLKGHAYAFGYFNDAHYYASMAQNLWGAPGDLAADIAALPIPISVADNEIDDFYRSGSLFSAFLHAENGLAHQPPYAYRIVTPTLAGMLHSAGLPLQWSFVVLYLCGVVFLAVGTYALVAATRQGPAIAPSAVAGGVTIAALATTTPAYPDMLFLGLATLSVWFAVRRHAFAFVILSALATGARETGALLALTWLLYSWSRRSGILDSFLPATGPILTVIALRVIVDVPNPRINYPQLIEALSSFGTVFWGGLAIATIMFVSPQLVPSKQGERADRGAIADRAMCVAGACLAMASMFLATNTFRMALLCVPYFIAPHLWASARSRAWLLATLSASIGFAAADTLVNRAGTPVGLWPWAVVATAALSLQLLARRREGRDLMSEQRRQKVTRTR